MKVIFSSHFHAYTGTATVVEARGKTLRQLMAHLDRQFPGLCFRIVNEQDDIRPHVNIFINGEMAKSLGAALRQQDEIHILGALSGG